MKTIPAPGIKREEEREGGEADLGEDAEGPAVADDVVEGEPHNGPVVVPVGPLLSPPPPPPPNWGMVQPFRPRGHFQRGAPGQWLGGGGGNDRGDV